MVRAALDMARQTEAPALRASTLADLATVLLQAQRPDEARNALVDAIAVYSAKGDLDRLRARRTSSPRCREDTWWPRDRLRKRSDPWT